MQTYKELNICTVLTIKSKKKNNVVKETNRTVNWSLLLQKAHIIITLRKLFNLCLLINVTII